MVCKADGRSYGLRRTRALSMLGNVYPLPECFARSAVVATAYAVIQFLPSPKSPPRRGLVVAHKVRSKCSPDATRNDLLGAWVGIYAARMFCKVGGRSYGLRRYTIYTLPLNLPPREGDFGRAHCALRAEPGASTESFFTGARINHRCRKKLRTRRACPQSIVCASAS